MSAIYVILVLKTVIYHCKFLGFQNFESLNSKHSILSTEFMDRLKIHSLEHLEINLPAINIGSYNFNLHFVSNIIFVSV